MIVIRHRDDIDPEMSVRIDGTEYNIKSVDSDPGINTFDVITMDLKKWNHKNIVNILAVVC